MVSNTVSLLAQAGIELIPDKASLSMQALFHRVPGRYTVYKDIFKTIGGDYFKLEGGTITHTRYYSPEYLMGLSQAAYDISWRSLLQHSVIMSSISMIF